VSLDHYTTKPRRYLVGPNQGLINSGETQAIQIILVEGLFGNSYSNNFKPVLGLFVQLLKGSSSDTDNTFSQQPCIKLSASDVGTAQVG